MSRVSARVMLIVLVITASGIASAGCDHRSGANTPSTQVGPPASSAPVVMTEVCNQNIDVREADSDVETNCVLSAGDEVHVSATGSIWAGVWGTGENGPQGWTWTAGDKFPKPSAPSYSLLARTESSYRYVGTGIQFNYVGNVSHVYLRINDDKPGNGSGSFQVNVHVYRR